MRSLLVLFGFALVLSSCQEKVNGTLTILMPLELMTMDQSPTVFYPGDVISALLVADLEGTHLTLYRDGELTRYRLPSLVDRSDTGALDIGKSEWNQKYDIVTSSRLEYGICSIEWRLMDVMQNQVAFGVFELLPGTDRVPANCATSE